MNLNVIPTAFTGIASSLIQDGLTVHSRFKIPIESIDPNRAFKSSIRVNESEGEVIRHTPLIIIDEASMVSKSHYQYWIIYSKI